MSTPPQHSADNSGNIWKIISLVPIVIVVGMTLWGMTRGVATLDQMKEERMMSVKELQELTAQNAKSFEVIWKNIQAAEVQLKELTRETDRRGPRLERLEQLEVKLVVLDTIQQGLATLRVELRVVQESQQRLEQLIERQGRRLESETGSGHAPKGNLPRGFP